MTQRGFISLSLMGWAAVAAGVVIVGLSVALKIQSSRLDAAQQKSIALEQQVAQWTGIAKACSDATEKLAKAAETAQKRAQAALSKARRGSVATQAEIARLRAANSQTCEAAVKTVREGLSK